MITLNLTTKNTEQEVVKNYLEENASEILAEKINNGVTIQKDGKTLINRKNLDSFMKYATDEAKKQAEKGSARLVIFSDRPAYLQGDPYRRPYRRVRPFRSRLRNRAPTS